MIKKWHELSFYKKQERIALKNCGKINPESIGDYIAEGGYESLRNVLGMPQEKIIDEIKISNYNKIQQGSIDKANKQVDGNFICDCKKYIIAQ